MDFKSDPDTILNMGKFFGLILMVLIPGPVFSGEIQFDSNVSPALRAQVDLDLRLAAGIHGRPASPLHLEIFGEMSGEVYRDWFLSRVKEFGFGNCGGSGGAVACVQSANSRKIWVTSNYTLIDHPEIARVMTLFHEARHTESENRNWPHSRCPLFFKEKSIWTGKGLSFHFACDRTEYGSYASASVMLNQISRKCLNCSDKIKTDAKIYSDDQVKRVTRKKSFDRLMRDFRQEKE
jgi:hypothetical protein